MDNVDQDDTQLRLLLSSIKWGAWCRGSKTDSRKGIGMERQDLSYGEGVHTSLRVQALLGGSNSPTSRCSEAVDWIIWVCVTGVRTLLPVEGGWLI